MICKGFSHLYIFLSYQPYNNNNKLYLYQPHDDDDNFSIIVITITYVLQMRKQKGQELAKDWLGLTTEGL